MEPYCLLRRLGNFTKENKEEDEKEHPVDDIPWKAEDVLNALRSGRRPLTAMELVLGLELARGTIYKQISSLMKAGEIEKVTVKVGDKGQIVVLYQLKKENDEKGND